MNVCKVRSVYLPARGNRVSVKWNGEINLQIFMFLVLLFASLSASAIPSTQARAPVFEKQEAAALVDLSNRKGGEKFTGINELLIAGKYEESIKVAILELKKHPDSGVANEILGTAYYLSGNEAKAIAALKRAIALEPEQSGALTKLGIIYMESGKLAEAEKLLSEAIKINPDYRFAHQRLGVLYEYQKKYPLAVRHYQRGLIGASSSYIGVSVNLARLLNKFGKYTAAISVLESRVPISAISVDGQLTLASSYLALGQYPEARLRFERVLQLDSTRLEALLGRARAQRGQGELQPALDSINMLITLKPDSVEARLERGEILLRLGQKSAADKAFDEAVTRGASRINVNRRIAQFHIERKEFSQAQDIYQSMVDDGSASVIIYSQLSELLLAQDNAGQGEKVLRDGLKKFPDSAYLTLRLGSYLAALRQYDKALPVFKRATELAPSDVTVWKSYSLALLRAGKKTEAVAAASKMIGLQPGNIELSVLYATILDADNQTAEAEKVYRKVLAVAPGHALSLNNLANILSDQKKYAEAEDVARRAVNALSDNGSIQDTLGWILYHRGKLSEASDVLAKASRLSPEIATIWYHQGVVLAEQKQGSEAKVALQKALQLNKREVSWVSDAKVRLQKL